VMAASPLSADVGAFLRAEREFDKQYGEEAQRRWVALGADSGLPLSEQQAIVIHRVGNAPEVWEVLEWEVRCRIQLLTEARRQTRPVATP
jgi:hypothetical protein